MANQSTEAFFELLRAGLWGTNAQFSQFKEVDFKKIYKTAEEQSVLGLIAEGIEKASDSQIPQEDAFAFVGGTLQIEQRNKAMNQFLVSLLKKLGDNGISSILVKGQGIAQCYGRPLWRACGDVDLLLNLENYTRAKQLLVPFASVIEEEDLDELHLGMTLHSWVVELHGSLRSCRLPKMDKVIDTVQRETIDNHRIRLWNYNGYDIPLPSPDNDVIFIFTHIIKHFFKEGVGLRQLCDWCRLLWTYKNVLNYELLESRLFEAGIETEWKSFAALAVDYLGMPEEAVPFYSGKKKWSRKARHILGIILKNGSFGHNRDISYYKKCPFLVRKSVSFWLHTIDSVRRFTVFPMDAIRAWRQMLFGGLRKSFKG